MADLIVTTLTDELDSSGPGVLAADPTDLSLREALLIANGTAGADTIRFAPDLDGGAIFLRQGQLMITDTVTVDGDIDDDGVADLTISAASSIGGTNATSRVFRVDGGPAAAITATLEGLVISDGRIAANGGAAAPRSGRPSST